MPASIAVWLSFCFLVPLPEHNMAAPAPPSALVPAPLSGPPFAVPFSPVATAPPAGAAEADVAMAGVGVGSGSGSGMAEAGVAALMLDVALPPQGLATREGTITAPCLFECHIFGGVPFTLRGLSKLSCERIVLAPRLVYDFGDGSALAPATCDKLHFVYNPSHADVLRARAPDEAGACTAVKTPRPDLLVVTVGSGEGKESQWDKDEVRAGIFVSKVARQNQHAPTAGDGSGSGSGGSGKSKGTGRRYTHVRLQVLAYAWSEGAETLPLVAASWFSPPFLCQTKPTPASVESAVAVVPDLPLPPLSAPAASFILAAAVAAATTQEYRVPYAAPAVRPFAFASAAGAVGASAGTGAGVVGGSGSGAGPASVMSGASAASGASGASGAASDVGFGSAGPSPTPVATPTPVLAASGFSGLATCKTKPMTKPKTTIAPAGATTNLTANETAQETSKGTANAGAKRPRNSSTAIVATPMDALAVEAAVQAAVDRAMVPLVEQLRLAKRRLALVEARLAALEGKD